MMRPAGARGLELATAAILLALVGAPFLFIALQAVFPAIAEGSLSRPFAATKAALLDPQLLRLSWNTVALGGGVVLASAALGAPLGLARGLLRLPGARVIDAALFIPFMIPPYLSTLGWILLLQPHGWLDQITGFQAGGFLFSFAGVVFVMTLNLFPIVYFAVARAAEAAGGRLVDVGRVFGASGPRAFVRIALPLAAPAVLASLLLVFSASIEEFGAPAALAGQSGFLVLVTAIDRRVADAPVDLPGASTLSLALVAMALIAYLVQDRALARRSFETIVGKPRGARPRSPGWLAAPLLAIMIALVLVAAGAPLLSIAAAAFSRTMSGGLRSGNLGWQNFTAILSDADGALEALLASAGLAAATALATAALGLAAAVCGRRNRGRSSRLGWLISLLTVLPNATPGVVVAVGLILAWNQPLLPVTFYGGWMMLVVAYSCILLPYPTRYAAASLRQIGANLEPAARVAGAGPLKALVRITLPLLAPSLISAMMLVFAISSRELVASTLLVPNGGQTVATFIWRQFEQGSLGEGMAMSLIAIAATSAALALVAVMSGQTRRL